MMLTGDNGILQRGAEAKNKTDVGKEKESITLAYNSLIIDKMTKENKVITADELEKAIKIYDANVTTSSEESKIIVTFSNGHKYTVYNNGTVGEYEEPPLAKDILTVTINGDETVESPYYVNYPSAKGTIKCRVLYNDNTYGLQIISANSVENVIIGKNDPCEYVTGEMASAERCINSYNRAIITLNEKAEEYVETTDGKVLATDARCVGSDPIFENKNYPDNLTGEDRIAEMHSFSEAYMNNYNEKIFKGNNIYKTDSTRLNKIGARKTSIANNEFYYLVRRSKLNYDGYSFTITLVYENNGSLNNVELFHINSSGIVDSYDDIEKGLRPIFKLSSNVKIIGGKGTEEVPFEIGL